MKRAIIISGVFALLIAAVIWAVGLLNVPQTVTISFVGDVLLARGVAEAMEQHGDAYPFEQVKHIFLRDSLTVANLECPLTNATNPVPKEQRIIFRAAPDEAKLLKQAGFDLVSLANNHTMDYMSAGLADTINTLNEQGIASVGATANPQVPAAPYIFSQDGINIGFLAYDCLPPEGLYRGANEATVMYARPDYLDDMREQIARLSQTCALVVVYFHWGNEYSQVISAMQQECARAAVDAGAGLVVGSHPHVLQKSERYKDGLIYYSLGNFIFDKQIPQGTAKTIILQVTVSKRGVASAKEIPVAIINCQPVPVD
ncbi:MAG: CapA family protein [Firmicutes bacterium]|nr:CapA family protein [Bacillota bacterium]